MRHWSDARWGAAVIVPGFDTDWLTQSASARPITLLVGLGALVVLALLVASAAYRNDRTRSRRTRDEELFTSTPLPMHRDDAARHGGVAPHLAYGSFKLPRWVQVGSLIVALGITWVVSQRIRPDDGRTIVSADTDPVRVGAADRTRDVADSPEDLDLVPDSAPDFSFRAREWVSSDAGCAGRLEVTKGAGTAWTLTARVHDDQGKLLDTALARVRSLRPGEVVEFHFPRAACERIGAWDVRGARRAP